MQISSVPQQNFKTTKELEDHLIQKVRDKMSLIFAQNSFNVHSNRNLFDDGLNTAKGMISCFSTVALLEGRSLELEKTMEQVIEAVAFNIMEKSKFINEMNTPITLSTDQVDKQKKLQLEVSQKIIKLEKQTTQKLSVILGAFFEGSPCVGDNAIRKKDKLFKKADQTYQAGFAKNIEKIIKDREASMLLMRKYLAIAEKKGCTPAQVTQKDLKEYEQEEMRRKEAIAKEHEKELLASFNKKATKKKQIKGKGAKTTAKVATAIKETFQEIKDGPKIPPQEISNTSSASLQKDLEKTNVLKSPGKIKNPGVQPKILKKEQILQARTEFMFPLHQRKILETSRVIRWRIQNPVKIREFTDRDKDGRIVKKYAQMNDAEIARQRIFHYLPGPEQLLGENYRTAYTFPTDKGCGVYASLFLQDEEWSGFLYFGEGNKDRKVYHKYFEMKPYETKDFIACFKDKEEIEEREDGNEKWESEKATFVTEISADGVLTVKFIGESHYIKIYPLKKELLPEIFYSAC